MYTYIHISIPNLPSGLRIFERAEKVFLRSGRPKRRFWRDQGDPNAIPGPTWRHQAGLNAVPEPIWCHQATQNAIARQSKSCKAIKTFRCTRIIQSFCKCSQTAGRANAIFDHSGPLK